MYDIVNKGQEARLDAKEHVETSRKKKRRLVHNKQEEGAPVVPSEGVCQLNRVRMDRFRWWKGKMPALKQSQGNNRSLMTTCKNEGMNESDIGVNGFIL